ncbi:rRNA N(6)-adenosine-methyltransferase ZCCHC4-like [Diadema antillarum]|uniref:rRNA N(6)-adenosine-methyltransferase ZCCHC4-like n=1 Tax=Diadema antillarum TaxID=105358 RepID=UPI003A899F8E
MCATAASSQYGVDVCLGEDVLEKAPHCPHGPTLLFERFQHGKQKSQRYFACSACRDRTDCGFFQLYSDVEIVSETKRLMREEFNRSRQPWTSQEEFYDRFRQSLQLNEADRTYCSDCHLLLLPAECSRHADHRLKMGISLGDLKRPSYLMEAIENNKTNAQYLFTSKTVQFLVDTLQSLGFNRVLCLGVPRLHEYITSQDSVELDSLLLDIDHRYGQFYPPSQFCRFNMFNHFFLDGSGSQETCREFLSRSGGRGVVVVTDPPFGGLVDVLASSVRWIMKMWQADVADSNVQLPVIWIFPYFLEQRIIQNLTGFKMLDYKVDYDNHPLFKGGPNAKKKGSPVRVFTNIDPAKIELPASEGYRFCEECQRFVASENQHCSLCKECPSKNGTTYRHCVPCAKCVKPSFTHCTTCNRCELPSHVCGRVHQGCHICGDLDHKRRDCPERYRPRKRSHDEMNGDKARKGKLWQKKKKKRRNAESTTSQIRFGPVEEEEDVASPKMAAGSLEFGDSPLSGGDFPLSATSQRLLNGSSNTLHETSSAQVAEEVREGGGGDSSPWKNEEQSEGGMETHLKERPHVPIHEHSGQELTLERDMCRKMSRHQSVRREKRKPLSHRPKQRIMGKTVRLMQRIHKMRLKKKIRLKFCKNS